MDGLDDTLTLPDLLAELANDLGEAAAVARAAATCAEAGTIAEAMRIAIRLDIALGEAQVLHAALYLLAQRGRDREA